MGHYLWEMRPYFRHVAGQMALGSVAGIAMNTMVVLPAILLGRTIDAVLALERGEGDAGAVGWAALIYVGGTLLTEGPRIGKRWWLMTGNARIRANIRADALRGVLTWPMARLHRTPVGDLMARIIGDVEVLGVGVREFSIESWDTILFSISLITAMVVFAPGLTVWALLPVPAAVLLAKATGRWVVGRTTTTREKNALLTTALQEQLSGIRVLRLFGRAGTARELVDRLSRQYADANVSLVRLRGGLRPVYTAMMTGGVVLVVWQGSERVIDGVMTAGEFIAFLELYLRFVNRGFRIPQMINSIQTGGAAYARLWPLLAPPPPVSDEPRYASFRAANRSRGTGDGLDARGHLPLSWRQRSCAEECPTRHFCRGTGGCHRPRGRRKEHDGAGVAGTVSPGIGPCARERASAGGGACPAHGLPVSRAVSVLRDRA